LKEKQGREEKIEGSRKGLRQINSSVEFGDGIGIVLNNRNVKDRGIGEATYDETGGTTFHREKQTVVRFRAERRVVSPQFERRRNIRAQKEMLGPDDPEKGSFFKRGGELRQQGEVILSH
jgi:hypothetical protein